MSNLNLQIKKFVKILLSAFNYYVDIILIRSFTYIIIIAC